MRALKVSHHPGRVEDWTEKESGQDALLERESLSACKVPWQFQVEGCRFYIKSCELQQRASIKKYDGSVVKRFAVNGVETLRQKNPEPLLRMGCTGSGVERR